MVVVKLAPSSPPSLPFLVPTPSANKATATDNEASFFCHLVFLLVFKQLNALLILPAEGWGRGGGGGWSKYPYNDSEKA
jgi:hypothetical protein